MQDGSSNQKQQIVDKLKQSANILVTVSNSPSVDALTAMLGLTLMLNKLDKHATAVFSGVVPPAINFLEPGKTFENNVDSLRDFIIALDKDKADRLRYKVEDDVVRIFITPYRTRITQRDLQFSQGDFNVDLIVALGVEDQKDLDQAISAHGRILHDATVVTINADSSQTSLGSINWQEGNASSLSELIASIAEQLKAGILDQQISTALLTGIVAATERFSNAHTNPRVMTVAAQLMAAGANQQLIATKLQTIPAPVSPRREKPQKQGGKPQQKKNSEPVALNTNPNGEMHIQHNKDKQREAEPESEVSAPEPITESEPANIPEEPAAPSEPELPIAPAPAQNFNELKEALQQETAKAAPRREMVQEPPTPGSKNINSTEDQPPAKQEDESYLSSRPSWQGREIQPPSMGGTLNATAEQALEDKQREESEQSRNRTILTHGDAAPQMPKQPAQQKQRKQKSKPAPQSRPPMPTPPPQQSVPVPEPVPAPEPIPPAPMPEPVSEPEPAPVPPVPEAPAPEPPAPAEPETVSEIPGTPPPLVVSEPLAPPPVEEQPVVPAPPIPAPEPTMPAQPQAAPTIEELQRQATEHAAQTTAPQTLAELENERHQAEATASPAPNPVNVPPMPTQPQPGLVQPMPTQPVTTNANGLPPMPPMPDFSTLPPAPGVQQTPQLPELPPNPAPPLPEQTSQQQPPQQPPTPPDPAQYRIPQ